MPTAPHEPPTHLPIRSFSTREAHALGLSHHHLQNPCYQSVTRGVWDVVDVPPPESPRAHVLRDLRAVQDAKPGTAASHITAALLLDLRLPGRIRLPSPLHLTQFQGRHRPTGDGIAGHVGNLEPQDIHSVRGVLVTGPVRTIVDLAALHGTGVPLVSDDQLVALLDGVICEHTVGPRRGVPPLRNVMAVRHDLLRLAGQRGVARVKRALHRSMAGADSALETQARLLLNRHDPEIEWVTDIELTQPGFHTVLPDLADIKHRLSLQLEGPHHDTKDQRVRDINRSRATEANDWLEIRATYLDLRHTDKSVPRLIHLVREGRRRSPVFR